MPDEHTSVLIIDTDQDRRAWLAESLADRRVLTAGTLPGARDLLQGQPVGVVVLCSNGLRHCVEQIRGLRRDDEHLIVVALLASADGAACVAALRAGAEQALPLPLAAEDLRQLVDRGTDLYKRRNESGLLREALRRRRERDLPADQVIAASPVMRRLFRSARNAAEMDASVLIEGETGSGKEVVARFLHDCSQRSEGPFNVVNCAALPESLVDAEFFGHEQGAFTGANQARAGIIEVSEGGTLLLDEIGDIGAPAQVRLLRVLENRCIRRVGGSRERPVDVRICAATHRRLETLLNQGRFRQDLFHRLVVIRLRIPPLRERREDIIPLAEAFLDQLCRRYADQLALHPDAHAALLAHPWLGNVRELRNVIERAWFATLGDGCAAIHQRHVAFLQSEEEGRSGALERRQATDCCTARRRPGREQRTVSGRIEAAVVRPTTRWHRDPADGRMLSLRELEDRHLHFVLERCAGNRRRAAEVLGISERSLYRRLSEQRAAAHS